MGPTEDTVSVGPTRDEYCIVRDVPIHDQKVDTVKKNYHFACEMSVS